MWETKTYGNIFEISDEYEMNWISLRRRKKYQKFSLKNLVKFILAFSSTQQQKKEKPEEYLKKNFKPWGNQHITL